MTFYTDSWRIIFGRRITIFPRAIIHLLVILLLIAGQIQIATAKSSSVQADDARQKAEEELKLAHMVFENTGEAVTVTDETPGSSPSIRRSRARQATAWQK